MPSGATAEISGHAATSCSGSRRSSGSRIITAVGFTGGEHIVGASSVGPSSCAGATRSSRPWPHRVSAPMGALVSVTGLLVVLLALMPSLVVAARPDSPPPAPPAPPGSGCTRRKCAGPPKPPAPPRRPRRVTASERPPTAPPNSPRPPRPPTPVQPPRPNFVVIVTDDQDEVLNSTHPAYMPALNTLVGSRGTRFANTLSSTAVCCPARVSLLTGRLAHCSNVTANWAPAGAYAKFSKLNLDADWLPGWLQKAGYRTGLVGKLFNGFAANPKRCPRGFDVLDALTTGTYKLFNSSFSKNCGANVDYWGQYQTDVIRNKALEYIDEALNASKPFYLHLTPAAPHTDNGGGSLLNPNWRPPPPAPRHANLYPGLRLPANPTFLKPNPLNPSKLIDMKDPKVVQAMTDLYVGRIRSLRAVDDMVQSIVDKLQARGVLNNTYIIYTSDNGLHFGQHSLDDGKATMLEEDSRVPLYISGPGVRPGVVSPYQANLVDIPPTVLALAGLAPRRDLDGLPLPLEGLTSNAYRAAMQAAVTAAAVRASPSSPPGMSPPLALQPPLPSPPAVPAVFRESTILEAWDSDAKNGWFPNITFKSLRLCSTVALNSTAAAAAPGRPPALMVPRPASNDTPIYCLKYNVWCRGSQRELYDLSTDPFEATNVIAAAPRNLLRRLDALLSVLVHCRGMDCAHPWGTLHPAGDVLTFQQAMDPRHDALYSSLPPFTYETCYPLYVPANERTFTLGRPGFPANVTWASTGIVWPLPKGERGLGGGSTTEGGE